MTKEYEIIRGKLLILLEIKEKFTEHEYIEDIDEDIYAFVFTENDLEELIIKYSRELRELGKQ